MSNEQQHIDRSTMLQLWVETSGLQDTDSPLTSAIITEGLEAAGSMDGSAYDAHAEAVEVAAGLERLADDITKLATTVWSYGVN